VGAGAGVQFVIQTEIYVIRTDVRTAEWRPGEKCLVPSSPRASQIRFRLEAVFPDRLRGVLLFGSAARREADPESDVDLLILLDGRFAWGRISARSSRPSIPCSST
jgi:hypothetical protein